MTFWVKDKSSWLSGHVKHSYKMHYNRGTNGYIW